MGKVIEVDFSGQGSNCFGCCSCGEGDTFAVVLTSSYQIIALVCPECGNEIPIENGQFITE